MLEDPVRSLIIPYGQHALSEEAAQSYLTLDPKKYK